MFGEGHYKQPGIELGDLATFLSQYIAGALPLKTCIPLSKDYTQLLLYRAFWILRL